MDMLADRLKSYFHLPVMSKGSLHVKVKRKSTNKYIEKEGQDGPASLNWLPDKFRVNWPGATINPRTSHVQEKKFNIDFQDRDYLGFPIKMILATSYIQVTSIFPMKFPVIWHFGWE